MMIGIVITGGICFLGVLVAIVLMENNKKEIVHVPVEKIVYQDRIVYKEIPVEKIVEKIVYIDRPVKTIEHDFIKKEDVKVSDKKLELITEINLLKNKKNRTKKDNENLYTLEMVVKNMR